MNFLQKGLAGLESRLDKVLLDEPGGQTSTTPPPPPTTTTQQTKAEEKAANIKAGRISLQERLAAATARKERGRSRSPGIEDGEPIEVPKDKDKDRDKEGEKEEGNRESDRKDSSDSKPDPPPPTTTTVGESPARPSTDSTASRPLTDPPPPPPEIIISPRASLETNGHTTIEDVSREDLETTITLLRKDLALCESRRQEESDAAAERIDALEDKIRYLARESAEASRQKANGAPSGLEKKLAEAQEKIALLLEEGQKLSKNELKLQTSIKRYRAKTQAEEKATAEAKRRAERAEKEAAEAKEKAKRAVENEKVAAERVKGVAKIESEVEGLRREKESSAKVIAELKGKLVEVTGRAEDAESRVQTEALEKERKITVELKAEVERVQSEAALVEERLQSEVRNLKAKMERDAERARIMEEELKGEQSMMESKMEALRARAEEVSSGASGDAHAKLLRQVETLQTQYAIASENWQGIEGKADVRRKARELSAKSKTLDLDLEISQSKINDLETELTSLKKQLGELKKEHAEEISALSLTFSEERENWQKELQTRLEEERTKWIEASRAFSPPSQASLPPLMSAHSMRKFSGPLSTSESYFLGSNNNTNSFRKNSRSPGPLETPITPEGLGLITSPSSQLPPPSRRGFSTPPLPIRQDSLPIHNTNNSSRTSLQNIITSTTQLTTDPDQQQQQEELDSIPVDFYEPSINPTPTSGPYTYQTPTSPYPQSLARHPDMISVSTVAAGPSVQLVERMSSTIRRLESELTAIREEMETAQVQRDEARREVVDMVREVEVSRAAEKRVVELEGEVEELKRREEYTLEMLGEKSELVDELRQDVLDLKGLYRDLVSTVK
ncbi:hypothetical protein L873DRAFT_1163420 [Choiromyces venosus 120613-1]|uniref:TATA element modulatory factor 1 TATA binding domain-containing protein n=1 Tax=Choiromyces venosus 120613-1 TaxID=1336337 RepID=A0A3N4JFF0_9PEZI|nr:hypothetical protein L873DRAFT_1163420 [Choiromyces venosus 120613-1]